MQALLTFLALFPSTLVQAYEDELIYRVSDPRAARELEDLAQTIILDNGLPLTAQLEEWGAGGFVFERTIRVKPVPEEHLIA